MEEEEFVTTFSLMKRIGLSESLESMVYEGGTTESLWIESL